MSVVNDVLNDLHKRRSQQDYQNCIAFVSDHESTAFKPISRYVWPALALCLAACSVYMYFYPPLLQSVSNSQYVPIYKQDNDFIKQSASKPLSSPLSTNTDEQVIYKSPVLVPTIPTSNQEFANTLTTEDVLNRAMQSRQEFEASEKNIIDKAIINQSDIPVDQSAKQPNATADTLQNIPLDQSINNAPLQMPINNSQPLEKPTLAEVVKKETPDKKINHQTRINNRSQDEAMIKQLMASEPEKVWPYVQTILSQSNNKIDLMALGAQGQQRSHQYSSALLLYQRLSQLQPKEAKWRAGAGISQDALGDKQKALRAYDAALKLNPLPPALASFVSTRIALLKGATDE